MKTLFPAVTRQMLYEAASSLKVKLNALPLGTVLEVKSGGMFGGSSYFLRVSKGWDTVTYTTRSGQVYLGTRRPHADPLKVSTKPEDMGVVVEGMKGKRVLHPIHLDALPDGAVVKHPSYEGVYTKHGDKWQSSENKKWVESDHFEGAIRLGKGLKVR